MRTSLVDGLKYLFNDPQVRLSVFHVQLEKLHLMDFGVCQHFGVCSTFSCSTVASAVLSKRGHIWSSEVVLTRMFKN